MMEEFAESSAEGQSVLGFLHRAAAADADGLVLTHGAGADSQSSLLTALADAFCAGGVTVLRCDLPFRQRRHHGPPPPGTIRRVCGRLCRPCGGRREGGSSSAAIPM